MTFSSSPFRSLALLALLMLVPIPTPAADIILGTVAVTNTAGTTNGQTITVQGATRTWTNAVNAPATQLLTNSTPAGAATTLFTSYAAYGIAGISLARLGTTAVTFQSAPGAALAISISPGWGQIQFSTNTLTSAAAVRVPVTVETAAARTNIASGIVSAINDSGNTNAINPLSAAGALLVGLATTQTVSGAKSMTNVANTFVGGVNAQGDLHVQTNGTVARLYFDAAGGAGYSNSIASGFAGMWFYAPVFAFQGNIVIQTNTIYGSGFSLGASGYSGNGSGATNLNGANLQDQTVTTRQLDQTGLILPGTNTLGDASFTQLSLSTLANGNNAGVLVGSKTYVKVSGPSAAFTINGINGNANRDGKLLILLNLTGQNMTIAHDSGVEPTAANRIYTLTGADRATTSNGAAVLIYDAGVSRWILISLDL